jgi:hypothetical protein
LTPEARAAVVAALIGAFASVLGILLKWVFDWQSRTSAAKRKIFDSMFEIQVPKCKSGEGEAQLAHRQFAKKFRLSRWKPVGEVSSSKFDGSRGTVAYELDCEEGWMHEPILKALYHKVELGKPATKLIYFVIQNPFGVPANRLFRTEKLQAENLEPILKENGISIDDIIQGIVAYEHKNWFA